MEQLELKCLILSQQHRLLFSLFPHLFAWEKCSLACYFIFTKHKRYLILTNFGEFRFLEKQNRENNGALERKLNTRDLTSHYIRKQYMNFKCSESPVCW